MNMYRHRVWSLSLGCRVYIWHPWSDLLLHMQVNYTVDDCQETRSVPEGVKNRYNADPILRIRLRFRLLAFPAVQGLRSVPG